jgi:hypothetical protein
MSYPFCSWFEVFFSWRSGFSEAMAVSRASCKNITFCRVGRGMQALADFFSWRREKMKDTQIPYENNSIYLVIVSYCINHSECAGLGGQQATGSDVE